MSVLEYMAITEVKTLDDALDVVNAVDHPAGGFWWTLFTTSVSDMNPIKSGRYRSGG